MKKIIHKFTEQTIYSLLWLLAKIPTKKKIVYFESFHGKQYSDNPRAIYELMKETHFNYELIWGVSQGYEAPFLDGKVTHVYRFSFRWLWLISHADCWIVNTRMPEFCYKSSRTTYIQTWHGTPLKKIGLDISNVNITGYTNTSYRNSFEKESKRWDFLISPNSYSTKIFKSAFSYTGDILEIGYPRNDKLVNESLNTQLKNQLKNKLDINENSKVILYAPTWRDNHQHIDGLYRFDTALDLNELAISLGENVTLLVRMHYLVKPEKNGNSQWLDVSDYPDMNDLLLISDILITDYSSSFFDYYILKRPIIFYLPDREQYENVLRGTYYDIEKGLPGAMVSDNQELIKLSKEALRKPLDFFNQHTKNKKFYDRIVEKETGNASQVIVDLIERKDT